MWQFFAFLPRSASRFRKSPQSSITLGYYLLVCWLLSPAMTAWAQDRQLVNVTAQQFPAGLPKLIDGAQAWGDYDQDGRLDLLIIGNTQTDIPAPVTLLYHNTTNGFVNVTDRMINLQGLSNGTVNWVDYDGDGWLDFFVTGWTGGSARSLLYRNKAGQSFENKTDLLPGLPGLSHSAVNWADYDKNGKIDLVITGWTGGQASDGSFSQLYLNQGSTGFVTASYFPKVSVGNGSLSSADFNGDDRPDLLITGYTGSERITKLYLGYPNWFSDVTRSLPNLPGVDGSSLAVGDYDRDGRPDLLLRGTADSGPASKLYHNRANNKWTNFEQVTQGFDVPGLQFSKAAWADYDNDGRPDLLVMGQTSDQKPFTRLYQNTTNGFVDVSYLVPNLPQVFSGMMAWGDYNKDGNIDFVIAGDRGGAQNYALEIYLNGGGAFEQTTGQLRSQIPPLANGSASWIDYKRDGRLSLFLTGIHSGGAPGAYLLYNNGDGAWENQGTGISPVSNSFAEWADFNQDGVPDVMVAGNPGNASKPGWETELYAGQAYTGNGKSYFFQNKASQLLPSTPGLRDGSMAWGDYDNDGYPDMILTGNSNTPLGAESRLYHNNAGQNFSNVTTAKLPNLPGLQHSSVAWGDYDNDGRLDLMVMGQHLPDGSLQTLLYHNIGNGFEETTNLLPDLSGVYHGSVTWSDYDQDGWLDLLVTGIILDGSGQRPITRLYRNKGPNPIFDDATAQVPNLPSLSNGTADWVDLENDGKLDLLLTGDTGSGYTTKFYHNTGNEYSQGNGFFDDSQIGSLQLNLPLVVQSAVAWGDYDNDGYPDLLITGKKEYEGPVSILFRNQSTNLGESDSTRFRLVAPAYNCQSGAFTFRTTGGNGSPIEYMAPGITSWTKNPNQFVDYELRQAADAQPMTIWARQSGNEVRYVFDIRARCPVGDPRQFRLVAPVYNCQSGAFTFQTAGGDGTPVEYMAAGITAWTGNPQQFVDEGLRQAADAKPLELRARQSGNEVRYVWDLRAICPVSSGLIGAPGQSPNLNFEDASSLIPNLPNVSDAALSWVDYDNDGWLDLMLTGDGDANYSRLYHNTRNGFEDVSSLIPDLPQVTDGALAWGDYDNDGRVDLFLTGLVNNATYVSKLYQNTASGFVDVSSLISDLPPVGSGAAAWGDYDNDGRLDLMLSGSTGSGRVSKLYHNTGSGFEDQSSRLPNLPQLWFSALAWGDYDNDGQLDLMLTGSTGNASTSVLYHNIGSGFEIVSDQLPDLVGLEAGSVAWNDFDNDGRLDLLLTGSIGGDRYTTRLYRNTAYGFEDASHFPGMYLSAVAWGDYDNDGLKDLIFTGVTSAGYTTKLYRNTSRGFVDASDQLPALPQLGYSAVAWGDYDNDGQLDLLLTGDDNSGAISKLYHNISPMANTPPIAPPTLSAQVADDGTRVQLRWQAGKDAQTPQAGLQYNLYVSDTPDGENVDGSMADLTTGYRRVVQLGNSQSTSFPLVGLTPGKTYYWSVQTIDGAFAGSLFAPEQRFTTPGLSKSSATQARLGIGGEPVTRLQTQVYPNPIETEFTVTIEGAQDRQVNLLITDLSGRPLLEKQVVVSQSTHQERLELGNVTSGLYLLRVSTATEVKTIKLIKAR